MGGYLLLRNISLPASEADEDTMRDSATGGDPSC